MEVAECSHRICGIYINETNFLFFKYRITEGKNFRIFRAVSEPSAKVFSAKFCERGAGDGEFRMQCARTYLYIYIRIYVYTYVARVCLRMREGYTIHTMTNNHNFNSVFATPTIGCYTGCCVRDVYWIWGQPWRNKSL